MIEKIKKIILEKIIDLFLEIESLKNANLEEIKRSRLKSLRQYIRKITRLLTFLDNFITDRLGEDKRFIRIPLEGNEEKYLIKPFKLKDFSCPPYPFVRMNKVFLEALSWLNQVCEEAGYKIKIVRGFVPYIRTGRFSWEFRLMSQHEKGKAVDIIFEGYDNRQTFKLLQEIFEKLEEKPFSLGFWENENCVHVGFVPFPVKKRFFPASSYRVYPCTSNPNLPFQLE